MILGQRSAEVCIRDDGLEYNRGHQRDAIRRTTGARRCKWRGASPDNRAIRSPEGSSGEVPMFIADLEIGLHRQEESHYVVELRLSLPDGDDDMAPVRGAA